MAFRFSLAAVLRIRLSLEEREERVLASIAQLIAHNHGEQEQLAVDARSAFRQRESSLKVAGAELHQAYQLIDELKQRKGALERKAIELAQLRAEQIRIYEIAHRSRRMLTDLYEKRREHYDVKLARHEQAAIDDGFNARRN